MGEKMSEDIHRIGLADAIEALHADLLIAAERATEHDFHFAIGSVDLEFQIGITKSADVKTGLRVWVVELGAGGAVAKESVQRIHVTLQAPVDENGNPVLVGRDLNRKP
jgi:NTP-dependent ternary system trypsin peptidase co-occuring protein